MKRNKTHFPRKRKTGQKGPKATSDIDVSGTREEATMKHSAGISPRTDQQTYAEGAIKIPSIKKTKIDLVHLKTTEQTYDPSNVPDNVVLCGKNTLHCKNKGNLLFKDYINSAIVPCLKYRYDTRFNRSGIVEEIINVFSGYVWIKLGHNKERLPKDQIRRKIRKALNDKISKVTATMNYDTSTKSRSEAERHEIHFIANLAAKAKITFNYFSGRGDHPLDLYPSLYEGNNISLTSQSARPGILRTFNTNEVQNMNYAGMSVSSPNESNQISSTEMYKDDGSAHKLDSTTKTVAEFMINMKNTARVQDSAITGDEGVKNKCPLSTSIATIHRTGGKSPELSFNVGNPKNEGSIVVEGRRRSSRIQDSNDTTNSNPSSTLLYDSNVSFDFDPTLGLSETDLKDRSVVIGNSVNFNSVHITSCHPKDKYKMKVTRNDKLFIDKTKLLINQVFHLYRKLHSKGPIVYTTEDMFRAYSSGKRSFSIISPCRERITLKVSHGSHRFVFDNPTNTSNEPRLLHRILTTQLSIPENCLMILDENLVHADTESLTCGFIPVPSPRYYSFVHHKDKDLKNVSKYHNFQDCGEDCKFCSNISAMKKIRELDMIWKTLDSNGLSLSTKTGLNDWIAGDIVNLGWVIVRIGVATDDLQVKRIGHEFQTLLTTKKPLKQYSVSTWFPLDDCYCQKDDKHGTINGTRRKYMENSEEVDDTICSIRRGQRRRIPQELHGNIPNVDWFVHNECKFIGRFFMDLETNLLHREHEEDGSDLSKKPCEDDTLLCNIVGVRKCNFKDYVFSGQCLIADFGFVPEQQMHMDYPPVHTEV